MQNLVSILFLVLIMSSCSVRFNAWDIDSSVQTFTVQNFQTTAGNAPPTIGQQFSEQLKIRVLSDTKLQYLPTKGDLDFSGAITSYEITAIAPKENETISLQRLTIRMSIDYKNLKTNKNWNKNFNRFADFSADANFTAIEEQLVTEIYAQIIEDVFNQSFANW